jgi:predicted enzyme related to lactoylglutathione lyase
MATKRKAANKKAKKKSAAGRRKKKRSVPGFFHGLRTAVYFVGDVGKAKAWYSEALGIQPYFDEPFYVGFNVGGYELGIHPSSEQYPSAAGGSTAYWGVSNAADAHARLLRLGATQYTPIEDVGGGIRIGAVRDPFGNILGIIENPHFKI